MDGLEWIIDAHGCDPDALRDPARMNAVFDRFVRDLGLTPVAPPLWHVFPAPGGVTGVLVLAESHLTCHTFPEFGSICLNLFCCRPRRECDAAGILGDLLGAQDTQVRVLERTYTHAPAVAASAHDGRFTA